MGIILSIETSSTICSVALHQKGELLSQVELRLDRSHSAYLLPAITDVLKYNNLELDQIDAFAISKGPGSYTGLRIGASTLKGLCFGTGKPLIAVNTLESMACVVNKNNYLKTYLCPMIDARRMEVYCLISDHNGIIIKETQPVIVDDQSFGLELESNRISFFGDGAAKCESILGNNKNAIFLNDVLPSAHGVGLLAWDKFLSGEFEDPAYFEPFYLKEFRAGKPKRLKERL